MNCIQEIRFTNAVIATDANNSFIEMKWTVAIVFELGDWYGMKVQQSDCNISVKNWDVWCEKGNPKYVE